MLLLLFSEKTFRMGEKMESHPTIRDIFTLDVTESISHGNNLLSWILAPTKREDF